MFRIYQLYSKTSIVDSFRQHVYLSSRADRLTKLVKEGLQTESVQVFDDSADGQGGHVEIEVISPLFAGKTRLQQHRMVNDVVAQEMSTIHALHVRTAIPE